MYSNIFNRLLLSLFSILLILAVFIVMQLYFDIRDQHNENIVDNICSEEIKKAMRKMGPKYDYMIKGEELYVDKGDGKWLRLHY